MQATDNVYEIYSGITCSYNTEFSVWLLLLSIVLLDLEVVSLIFFFHLYKMVPLQTCAHTFCLNLCK